MAATSGLVASSTRFSSACVFADRDNESSQVFKTSNTLMSAPAMKVVPAPMSTMAWAAGSATPRATACSICSQTAGASAFTGGLSIVTTATPSFTWYRTRSDMDTLFCSADLGACAGNPQTRKTIEPSGSAESLALLRSGMEREPFRRAARLRSGMEREPFRRAARILGFQLSAWCVDDDAGRRAVRVQLAVAIDDAAFRGGGAAAEMHDLRFAEHRTDVVGERAREVDLQLERGEAFARRHHRVDAATECRIEQRGG